MLLFCVLRYVTKLTLLRNIQNSLKTDLSLQSQVNLFSFCSYRTECDSFHYSFPIKIKVENLRNCFEISFCVCQNQVHWNAWIASYRDTQFNQNTCQPMEQWNTGYRMHRIHIYITHVIVFVASMQPSNVLLAFDEHHPYSEIFIYRYAIVNLTFLRDHFSTACAQICLAAL